MVLRPFSVLRRFLRDEAAGGLLLMAAAALAMLVANSPLSDEYEVALHARLGPLTLAHWINDGLMSLFFLLVGLEIKRELVDGHLATAASRRLPVVLALAGMAMPALVYLGVAGGDPALVRGWGIPAATDIAFAIGVLALLGRRVPASIKLLLTTVAIVDDMGAVLIIALFYTDAVAAVPLVAAAFALALLIGLNRAGVARLWPYLLVGAGLWAAILASGVHATVAGVLLAATVPIRRSPAAPDDARSPLHRLEHGLGPWVAFGIVPLFGFANAGVPLSQVTRAMLFDPLTIGIAAGLFVGKQIGIFAGLAGAVASGLAPRPRDASWLQLYGMALLCGIGFTMSLFIGGLAFADPLLAIEVRVGVLAGSLLSALAGYAVLRLAPARGATPRRDPGGVRRSGG